MRKPIRVPQPPRHGPLTRALVQEGMRVSYIWLLKEAVRATIESQYATAEQIAKIKGVSMATAYRIINRVEKRYWLCDMTDEEHPKVFSVLPMDVVKAVEIKPIGNPNFKNGIYQQTIALKRRHGRYKRLDNLTN